MIITCEEDQLRHEQHLRDTFSKRTADLGNTQTRLYEALERTEEDALNKIGPAEGERPLFACFHSLSSFAVVTNQRLIWLTDESAIRSLTWEAIRSINQGTAEQRKTAKESESREERDQERLKWNSIEVTEKSGQIHTVVFESGPVLDWIHWCLIALHGTYHRQQRGQRDPDAYVAHKYSSGHREQIQQSDQCGCFYCLHIFQPTTIVRWIDREATAMCPQCDIDSVIGSQSGYQITKEFLERMKRFWF